MKTSTRLLTLFFSIFLLPAALWANVIVKGHVNYFNGTPAPNYEVHIATDSSIVTNNCVISHTRFTNASGVYQDTLVCTSPITFVLIYIKDCNNYIITHYVSVPPSGIVESNFSVCQNNQCQAEFSSQTNISTVNFFSGNSSPGNTTATIIKRSWFFGDGTSITGNVINPVHTYTTSGIFSVCLIIKTSDSCESAMCHSTLVAAPVQCQAAFTFSPDAVTPNKIKFNSAPTFVSFGDSIISRKWIFGDGDSLLGNNSNPTHQYAASGNYTVCLSIKTKYNCESRICQTILAGSAVVCHALFTYAPATATSTGQNVHFNGWVSTTFPGDSLYHFVWNFGDGGSATTGDPNHVYVQSGTYNVCLRITSYSGCVDSICHVIVVPPLHCKAAFSFSLASGSTSGALPVTIHFQSNGSSALAGDSIIRRKWTFGDGQVLIGNNIDVNHTYVTAGTYNICLYIETSSGCKDTVCTNIVIAAPSATCTPRFTISVTGLGVHFNGITSTVAPGDSILTYLWTFGDSTSATTVDPYHVYAHPGVYRFCLRITSRNGCIQTKCETITVTNTNVNCSAHFTAQMPAPHVAVFNSSSSYASQATDSIVSRKWTFGDGQSLLTGNTISPTHQYGFGGTYNVCLSIRTRLGCESRWCTNIHVIGDTAVNSDAVHIVSLYPNPVNSPLNVVIWSRNPNVTATLAIYDVYGVVKYSITKVLPIGNSTTQIPTSTLASGPYIFKLTTVFGSQSRSFFKL